MEYPPLHTEVSAATQHGQPSALTLSIWQVTLRKNLIIVCAGDQSLHTHWLVSDRQYDVMVIYFGENQHIADAYQSQCDFFFREKGLKFELARKVLLHKLWFDEKLDFYQWDYIWFADDDLHFDAPHSANALFQTARSLRADFFQPAIGNGNANPAWEPTKVIDGAIAHRTNIIEGMMPGFSSECFINTFFGALHAMDFSVSGWGLEVIFARVAEAIFNRPVRTFVIDSVPINHTRYRSDGGGQGDRRGMYEAQYVPQIYTNRIRTIAAYKTLSEALTDQDASVDRDRWAAERYHQDRFGRA